MDRAFFRPGWNWDVPVPLVAVLHPGEYPVPGGLPGGLPGGMPQGEKLIVGQGADLGTMRSEPF